MGHNGKSEHNPNLDARQDIFIYMGADMAQVSCQYKLNLIILDTIARYEKNN